MKQLTVKQCSNPKYQCAGRTFDVPRHVYVVTGLVDTLTPYLGQILLARDVKEMCHSVEWKVVINESSDND